VLDPEVDSRLRVSTAEGGSGGDTQLAELSEETLAAEEAATEPLSKRHTQERLLLLPAPPREKPVPERCTSTPPEVGRAEGELDQTLGGCT
jgi:hypothetical protein